MQNSWEQQQNESQKSFCRFVLYRDMGTDRSLRKLAKELELNLSTLAEASKKHDWLKRSADFDAYIDKASQFNRLTQVKDMKRRQIALALKAQEVAERGLKELLKKWDEEKATGLRLESLSKILDIGCRLERLNRDEHEQSMEVTQTENYDNLSFEELETLNKLMLKARENN